MITLTYTYIDYIYRQTDTHTPFKNVTMRERKSQDLFLKLYVYKEGIN